MKDVIAASPDLNFLSFIPDQVFINKCSAPSPLLSICPSSEVPLLPAHKFLCVRSIVTKRESTNECPYVKFKVRSPVVVNYQSYPLALP